MSTIICKCGRVYTSKVDWGVHKMLSTPIYPSPTSLEKGIITQAAYDQGVKDYWYTDILHAQV